MHVPLTCKLQQK